MLFQERVVDTITLQVAHRISRSETDVCRRGHHGNVGEEVPPFLGDFVLPKIRAREDVVPVGIEALKEFGAVKPEVLPRNPVPRSSTVHGEVEEQTKESVTIVLEEIYRGKWLPRREFVTKGCECIWCGPCSLNGLKILVERGEGRTAEPLYRPARVE